MIISYFRGCAAALAVAAAAAPASTAKASCPPDINGDGAVNASDLLRIISDWGSCPSWCPADIAPPHVGDDEVNVADLLAVVSAWGSCPATCTPAMGCLLATPIWCENFELNNYSRWTSGYSEPTACEVNGFDSTRYRSASRSHKSSIVCSTSSSHRGYGGLRFQGDLKLPNYSTPSTGGINAPHGVVVTQWVWVESGYTFDSSRWLSVLTVTHDCSNNWSNVLTLGIGDSSMRLKPAHASVTYATGAPAFPRGQWNRITTYINYYSGSMHVWQNGTKVCSATFSRPTPTMCQWHFGLYASGPNYDVTMYEDDYSIVRLLEPMQNFTAEPKFPLLVSPCGILP